MNPIKLAKQLQDTLVSYLTTTFDVNRDGQEPALAEFIRQSFNRPRALFAGPYLELTPPYKTAETLQQLAAEGVVSHQLLQMECFRQGRPLPIDAPLYSHQATALRKLCAADRNIVVSSGTGSGKTECFLIPILNDLLIDPAPGVRAVLVYPLNALVNDQLDRLRELLRGTDSITFGRYTSELEETADSARKQMKKEWEQMEPARKELFPEYPLPNEIIGRDQIREGTLPHILITNYAMLEYLLLRPQDNPLFAGKWRFVVLDEAHTYAGAQGIEVGLLMRRLKLRLGHQPGQLRCIATSATLTNDDASDACRFAEALFGEEFTSNDIIFGEPNHSYIPPAASHQPPVAAYVHEQFDKLIDNVRQERWESTDEIALLMQEIGLISVEQLSWADKYDPSRFFWEVLRGNEDLARLRKIMADEGQPVEVAAVSEKLFRDRLPTNRQEDALYHLIELAAMARPAVDKPSLLPARYHLFVRPPQGIWACLNPTCLDKQAGNQWSKLFATPRETCDVCQSPVFPLVVCRTCGQVYVRLQKVGKQYLPEAALQDKPQTRYVTWRSIHENLALAEAGGDDNDEDTLVEQAGESVLKQTEMLLCLACQQEVRANRKCGCQGKSEHTITLYLLQNERPVKRGGSKGTTEEVVEHMNECGRCHGRALKDTEIATEITLNALTPLAILTGDLYRALPESPQHVIKDKPGSGRKLLSFYDSRQGAARFAAFVQDVVNQQAYRRIIGEAVLTTSTETFWPNLEKVAEACLTLAIDYRVAHNDPAIRQKNLPRNSQYISQNQRKDIIPYMRKQIFAEITTQLRSRQSLEALGLMAIQYFEPDHIPDFGDLGKKLKLTASETRTLVEYLLDDLRRGKVVTLPDGVQRDDPIFGRNKFSPRLVRSQDAGEYEISWSGKTTRHRRRQLIGKVFRHKRLIHDESTIIKALDDILEWLIYQSDLLDTSRAGDGYQLRHDRLFFHTNAQWYRCTQCQRLNNRGNALPCPHAHCQGTLRPIEIYELEGGNFYYDNLRQKLIPMRIEEHTAQLDPQKGRDYQNKFKNGDINMLSCSTTFEMGIDLGDLQAVVMSNIPPTVANYRQRAGRAGRRTTGTAFILAWASNRPHDQTYFKTPAEIIGGRVRVPFIEVQNPIIIQRHVNAVLFSEFLRYCASYSGYNKNIGAFFDDQVPNGAYYQLLPQWMKEQQEYLLHLLDQYAVTVKHAIDPPHALELFMHDIRQKGYDRYQTVAHYYKEVRQELVQKLSNLIMESNTQRDDESALSKELDRYRRLLERLQNDDTINYLSDRGVLPSYSFPLHVVELRIPPHLLPDNELRLQRNLQQAIREYAPGQEVVADKRIWKSEALDFFGKEPQIFAYHICPNCNRLLLEETPGKALDETCPVCHKPLRREKQYRYIQPDGFRASNDSGQPAGQYVDRPFNLMRSALVPGPVDTVSISQVLAVGYDRAGALLYVNEGFQGSGFRICLKCGKDISKRATKCDGTLNGQPCPGKPEMNTTFTLGFKQYTDTLHLKFTSTPHILLPEPDNIPFWLSLKYALLHGASRALQIERKDIDGVLFPESPVPSEPQWRQSIVLYDSVPGGAGHVKRIQDEIAKVITSALEIVDCDCEKSCYRCLKEYANQWEHHLLDRMQVVDFLRALDADLQQSQQGNNLGLHPVAAVNPTVWLWEHLQRAHQQIVLYANQITLQCPTAEGLTWLDLIQTLLQHGIRVRLYLNQLPDQTSGGSEAIVLAAHLGLLLRKGLDLRQTNRQLSWLAIIDPTAATSSAIKTTDQSVIRFGSEVASQLSATYQTDAVLESWKAIDAYRGRAVELVDLREPADIIVREVKPDGKRHDEAEYFTEFYAKQAVKGMIVSDRYLDTKEKILNRLGAHIDLAQKNKGLEWVVVKTWQAQDEQKQAINQLKSRFPQVKIKFEFDRYTTHDRYIEVTCADGHKARVIIGTGLDFIESTGNVRNTFLVFQTAYTD